MDLTPYLIFDGQCEAALKFYEKALGGKIEIMKWGGSPAEEMAVNKDWVMHATFEAKGFTFLASDRGKDSTPPSQDGMIWLTLNFETESEEEKMFNALSEGGNVAMPLSDTFWGARFGMVKDKFGIGWMFNCEKQQQKQYSQELEANAS
ncbi:MAG TPA: VOC family protein [Chitinophagaceae bacterium]|nr:VOC family protein [Chitinophagaceae bacterium]